MSNLLDLCNELWFDIKSDWRGHVLVLRLVAITLRLTLNATHRRPRTQQAERRQKPLSTKGARGDNSLAEFTGQWTRCVHTHASPANLGISLSTRDITQLPRFSVMRVRMVSGLTHSPAALKRANVNAGLVVRHHQLSLCFTLS